MRQAGWEFDRLEILTKILKDLDEFCQLGTEVENVSLHFHSVKRWFGEKLLISIHLDDRHRRHCTLFSIDG